MKFIGPLYGSDKRDAFAAASLFILPSYSEGAPMVILEALGAGVPVITTQASPWHDLATYRCGYWTGINVEEIQRALTNAFNLTESELKEMGQRGRSLVGKYYTWENSSEMIIQFYKWLKGEITERPIFVK
ncbi:glycosyltransferase [Deinococcus irradiatisoli]|uniref:glycosyltransferase n=1 Tax=Deinococcus irradiatisoli TaxID=2202254 RepID=UPI001FE43DE8|nr:glycosyltransferase [Deinococcus irradiatisoli]